MPSNKLSFAAAYAAANPNSNAFSPVPCVKVGGRWFIYTGGPIAAPAGGASSPAEAVKGFVQSAVAGKWSAFCDYWVPASHASCVKETDAFAARHARFTGTVAVHRTVTDGTKALVAVTGRVCPPGGGCQKGNDANSGMPHGSFSFADAWAAVTSGNGSQFSPVPCVEVGDRWYADASS